ncbi:MAG: hypothetical protein KGL39_56535 [Patescibacteria group bacterium]|nr:hypothetical protein [Patescibacteria group bacterium]
MNRYIPTIALLAGLALAGCVSQQPPVAQVSAAEAALAAAGKVALGYMRLPVCTTGGPQACAKPVVKAQIKTAYDAAYGAVTAAQTQADAGQSPDMTAALSALATLQSLVATLPKTGG